MMTSSNPHSGKTFITTNLAVTIALTGKKVLILDLDLRRRTFTKSMGHAKNPRGVSSYMSNTNATDIKDYISSSSINSNLDIMYSGPKPPNPSEMLLSKRFDSMIEELRTMYDYVIIDSVPAFSVADAVITDRVADLTIYIIREGVLDRRLLPDIERLYKENKFKNM